jgi:hypothetical protein
VTHTWQHVWRKGLAPQFSPAGLARLAQMLRTNDARLLRDKTTMPVPLLMAYDWPCEAACPITTAACERLYDPEKPATVDEAVTAFADACHACDEKLNVVGSSRWFTVPWDGGDLDGITITCEELLAEVERSLGERTAA